MEITIERACVGSKGVTLEAGETYDVDPGLAMLLIGSKQAKPAADKPSPEPKPEPPKKKVAKKKVAAPKDEPSD